MAKGLAIDLKTALKVGSVKLITSTPGMTVQIYGANGNYAAGVDHRRGVGSRSALRLDAEEAQDDDQAARLRAKAFRFLNAVDQRSAPASAVGTTTAPGHVSRERD